MTETAQTATLLKNITAKTDTAEMKRGLLERILTRLPSKTIAVVGDFFLDKYLIIDPALDEPSIETGLMAHQVAAKRLSPGAAGTIAANLRALGVGTVHAVGIIGRDGDGFDLKSELNRIGVSTQYLVETPKRMTPTYTKPMRLSKEGAETEMNRQDIKNRTPTPPELEVELIERLRGAVASADAVVAMDQVSEPNCGVVTNTARAEIAALARAYPETVFLGDSRERIDQYRGIYIKPNRHEAVRAVYPDRRGEPPLELVKECAETLAQRVGKPLYVTLGEEGVLTYDGMRCRVSPTLRLTGLIDIVGAGDSASSAIASALCCGALMHEAAELGNIAASIVVQQIGTTGTASPAQIRARWAEFEAAGI